MNDGAIRDEDKEVIESIRRLVTDRSAALGARTVPAAPGPTSVPDKLVLTPALRVESDPEAIPAPAHQTNVEVGTAPGEGTVAWSLEDRIAELEAALGGTPADWEPDGSEDARQETPDRFVFAHRPLPLTGREVKPDARATRAAEVASGFAEVADEVSPAEPLPESAEPEVDRDPETSSGPESPGVDTEALRGLIAEIVREELRGALGHQATRNIRKLVRREIRLALDLNHLDD